MRKLVCAMVVAVIGHSFRVASCEARRKRCAADAYRMGREGHAGKCLARISASADGAVALDEPQWPLGLRGYRGCPKDPFRVGREDSCAVSAGSPLSGVGRLLEPKETLWYRRMFNSNIAKGERLLLNFEQCDFRAHVFVNGIEAGLPHEGGQMPFSYDVTDIVRDGANELVVRVARQADVQDETLQFLIHPRERDRWDGVA